VHSVDSFRKPRPEFVQRLASRGQEKREHAPYVERVQWQRVEGFAVSIADNYRDMKLSYSVALVRGREALAERPLRLGSERLY